MAETLVQEKVCGACGADVRPQALFCYNCGSAVAPDAPLIENNNNKKASNAWFQDEIVADERRDLEFKNDEREDDSLADEEEIEVKEISENESDEETADDETSEKRDLSKMDSAAKLRKRGKSVQKKRVEIVWEEHDNAPNGWFIFVALVLTVLAFIIWIISTYLE